MSDDSLESLYKSLDQLSPDDRDGNIQILLQIVARQDVTGDIDSAYQTRMQLMDHATFASRTDLLMVCYAWCLATFDKHPNRFDQSALLWRYKWVLSNATDFAAISSSEIDRLLADFGRRIVAAGYNVRTHMRMRMTVHLHRGELDQAIEIGQASRELPRDSMSDCLACELDSEVEMLRLCDRHDEAIERAKPLLSEKLTCSHVPQRTRASLLPSFVATGREELITQNQSHWLAAWRDNLDDHWVPMARYACHVARKDPGPDQIKLAVQWIDELSPHAAKTKHEFGRWNFASNAGAVMRAAAKTIRRVALTGGPKINLGIEPEMIDAMQTYDTNNLADALERIARQCGRRLDERNGNDWYTRDLHARLC